MQGALFLSDLDLRPLDLPETSDLRPVGLALGNGPQALELCPDESRIGLRLRVCVQRGKRASREERRHYCSSRFITDAPHCAAPRESSLQHIQTWMLSELSGSVARRLAEPDRHSALRFLRTRLVKSRRRSPGSAMRVCSRVTNSSAECPLAKIGRRSR